ncbi:GNAT family N-acetyltransferase [Methylophaga pinxianii]|uniref:GNAT family N-acetyltransferase n=1 Tax=Methylophaga pinxianii TaxID=2881052 RepID=UPI001CF3AA20|nr:GNAT family N-acetyltransferase [Methylophaga pinxianii]MCB2427881.1 GNAT family N-acetyltransferase [Methylophaga pinxianii]UPH44671.1 GNAT family N-acetyltransferase [Methylophaga pinxianii]
MEIHTAVSSDIPQLCMLLDTLFSQEAEFKPDSELQALGLGAIIEGDGIGDILIAKQSDQIIGMVNLLYTVSTALGSRVAILEDMVIAPQQRGLGVGSLLLNYAIDFAKQKGCKRITLLTDNDNEAAHRFYEQHGFTESSMVTYRLFLDF